jgi:hypothetical protein
MNITLAEFLSLHFGFWNFGILAFWHFGILEFWHSEIGSSTLGRRATKPNFFLPRKSG